MRRKDSGRVAALVTRGRGPTALEVESPQDWLRGAVDAIQWTAELCSVARTFMVWSLSKDDDGLESVHPLTNREEIAPSSEDRALSGAPRTKGRAAHAAPNFRSAAPNVFVEPSSQTPQGSPLSPWRGEAEATMVLKGRRLDELRAEVARQKLSYRREKQHTLLLWVSAGGIALSLGWFVGMLLSPAAPRKMPAALDVSDSPTIPTHRSNLDRKERVLEDAPEAAPEETTAVHLGDLPKGEEAEESETPTAPGASDTSAPSGKDTFTLDDLPAE